MNININKYIIIYNICTILFFSKISDNCVSVIIIYYIIYIEKIIHFVYISKNKYNMAAKKNTKNIRYLLIN